MPSSSENDIPRAVNPQNRENCALAQLRATLGLEHIVGEDPAFVTLIQQIPAIAKYDVSLMILGETGTGKEVFARAVHYCSPRAGKPFIPVNCGAIPPDLFENEFFGHESGAFTSANSSRRGVIKEADGGTLFLDEVDCLAPLAQVKLLRFLQDGQFRPLGSASEEWLRPEAATPMNPVAAVRATEQGGRNLTRSIVVGINVDLPVVGGQRGSRVVRATALAGSGGWPGRPRRFRSAMRGSQAEQCGRGGARHHGICYDHTRARPRRAG